MKFQLLPRTCPICKSVDQSELFADANFQAAQLDEFAFASRKLPEYMHWRLMRCGPCDLVYANPAPPIEELATLYKEAAFASKTEAGFASRTYGRILKTRVMTQLSDRSAALDIGTGDGAFLHELINAGFRDVVGIEPSSAPIESADARVRPMIRQGLFEPDVFAPEQFRVITCFQTIEHVPDPLALCAEAFRLLKPGGALLLVGHNRRAVSAKLMGRKSPIFDIEHLQLFSRTSFRTMLKVAGFNRVETCRVLNVYPVSYWAQLFPLPRRLKRLAMNALRVSQIGKLPLALPAGNMAAIAFK